MKKLCKVLCLFLLTSCGPEGTTHAGPPDKTSHNIVELGKQLFFDKRLSANGDVSCESCHIPEKGWADGQPLSKKFDGALNSRHTPTLINVALYRDWSWDGRASSLDRQIAGIWKSQMGADPDKVSATLSLDRDYKRLFVKHLGGLPTASRVAVALAAFVETIESRESPWDRYEMGDRNAVTHDAKAGFEVFAHKAHCAQCHLPPLYTDTLYHNVGIGFDKSQPDRARGGFLLETLQGHGSFDDRLKARSLIGAFKTPTLRSITETAPYFHDGRAATLEEAVDLMLAGGIGNRYLDPRLKPKVVTPEERRQLMAFLRSLTPTTVLLDRP